MNVDSAMAFHLQKTYKSEGGDYSYKLYELQDGTYDLVLQQGSTVYKNETPLNLSDKKLTEKAKLVLQLILT